MELATKIIAIEGDDGSGKSTAASFLVERLLAEDKKVLHVGPNNLPPYAKEIREIVTGPNLTATSRDVQALMFTSYLLNIYDELVNPNMGKYDYIVIDRTYLSTLVYQSHSLMLGVLEPLLPEHMNVDVLIYLSVKPGVGLERIKSRHGGMDDYESSFTIYEVTRRHRIYEKLYEELPIPVKHHVNANRAQINVLLSIRAIVNKLVTEEEGMVYEP